MSGLIWAGLGKGIAAAGETVGNAMMKQQMMEDAKKAELEKEERADKRFNEREDAKTAKEEAKTEARAKLVRESYKDAEDMPVKRDAKGMLSFNKQLGVDAEMSEADMETVRNLPPEARKAYEESGILDKQLDPRIQRHADAAEAAAGRGADSKTMDYFEDAKKKALEVIREENKVVIERNKDDTRLKIEGQRFDSQRASDASKENIAAGRNATVLAAIGARGDKADKPDPIKERTTIVAELRQLEATKPKKPDMPTKASKERYETELAAWKETPEGQAAEALRARQTELLSPKPSTSKPAGGQSDRLSQFKVIR